MAFVRMYRRPSLISLHPPDRRSAPPARCRFCARCLSGLDRHQGGGRKEVRSGHEEVDPVGA